MAGGNGHLDGIGPGAVLRLRNPRVFPTTEQAIWKAHKNTHGKKEGNGRSEKAKRKPHNNLRERSPAQQRVEYEVISAKLIL